MLFPTVDFAVFFAIVFVVTWSLNRHNSAKKLFLLAASYAFYSAWDWRFVPLLFASSVGNFAVGLLLDRVRHEMARRALLAAAVAVNLGVLGYFKYYNFFVASAVNALAAIGFHPDAQFVEITLPVAISFLTFHALSYVIDVYRGRIPASRSLTDLLLYISFFPHLVAGPVVRAQELLPQLAGPSNPLAIRLGRSTLLIVGGLFKKVVIANYLSTGFVDPIFNNPGDFSSLDLLLGMYAYAIQIYCDFSAYTDIAIGVANLLGYEFPQNFDQPYRATSVREFWRRWHMTLSRWLRDYLYIPLGGNRHGTLFTYRNLMITMVLGGLWHGASSNFVIWGALHGSALVVEHMAGGRGEARASSFRQVLAWLATFHFVCIAWVFFRAPTLDASMTYLRTLVSAMDFRTTMTPFVALLLAAGFLTQAIPADWLDRLERRYDEASLPVKVLAPFAAIFVIAVAAPIGIAPFIYFQF